MYTRWKKNLILWHGYTFSNVIRQELIAIVKFLISCAYSISNVYEIMCSLIVLIFYPIKFKNNYHIEMAPLSDLDFNLFHSVIDSTIFLKYLANLVS